VPSTHCLRYYKGRMPIYLFAASIIFVVAVARKRQIRALSPYGIFVAFQILYNITPWGTAAMGVGGKLFSLLSDQHIVNIQLVLSTTANLCFGLVHLVFFRNVKFAQPLSPSRRTRRNYLYLAFPLFLVTCVLCHFYGWHQYTFAGHEVDQETLGGMFTVTAYFKFVFVAAYLYYLYRFGLDKYAWILVSEQVVVMVVDGARTTFLPVLLVTLFILLDRVTDKKMMRRIYGLAIAGIVLSIGTRSLIFHDSSLLQDMIIPVTIEGGLGDYSSLQSIQGVEKLAQPPYTYGASYLVDPFVFLIPKSIGRASLSPFGNWSASLTDILEDKFSPMGGFYYLSEAVAAYSYAGPAIVTTIFAGFLVWIERNKNRHRMLYLAWMPTIGILFVKTQFGNGMKLFVIEFLAIYLIFVLSKARILFIRSQRNARGNFVPAAT
jgi:hypothetical protein